LKLQEIEEASGRFKVCPKCNSAIGFWLGMKHDKAYVQCKSCGAQFELSEVYRMSGKGKAPERLTFFKK